METYSHTSGVALAQAALLVLLGPLVTGFIQKLKARLQCRQGASVWQPYRDLAKLLRKGTVQSDTASPFFRAVPVLVLAATADQLPPCCPCSARADGRRAAAVRRRHPAPGAARPGAFPLARSGALDAGGAFGGHGRLARDDRRPAGRAGPDDGRLLGRGRGRHDRAGRPRGAAPYARRAVLAGARSARALRDADPDAGRDRAHPGGQSRTPTSSSPCSTRACCSSTRGRASPASCSPRTPSSSSSSPWSRRSSSRCGWRRALRRRSSALALGGVRGQGAGAGGLPGRGRVLVRQAALLPRAAVPGAGARCAPSWRWR